MKCPIDKTEMKQGSLGMYMKNFSKKEPSFLGSMANSPLYIWYCPECGKVEFTTDPEKGEK